MTERVFFADVATHRAMADSLFAQVEARLRKLVPTARIEHVAPAGRTHEGRFVVRTSNKANDSGADEKPRSDAS